MPVVLPTLDPLSHEDIFQRLSAEGTPIPIARALLKDSRDLADQYFRTTLDAIAPVHFRSRQMDELLQALWKFCGLSVPDLALIAVGGYGRGELHPHSDVDLLLLANQEEDINGNSEGLQTFITLLWDLKLEVGHSVRTLQDCHTEASQDLTIITNLLESRLIVGPTQLYQQLKDIVHCQDFWPAQQFFVEKWQELQERHEKHNDSEYNLEPNVKNSPGALRDVQTISWVTARYFGNGSLKALEDNGFLTSFEQSRLARSVAFLWQVRYALHMLTGREEDRLLFNLQREIAELLGFEDDGNRLGVENFMTRFYRNQLATTEICDLLLLHFNEDFMKCEDDDCIVKINEHIHLQNGYLQIKDDNLFAQDPSWILRIFVLAAQTPDVVGIHSDTIRALRGHRHLIDDDFRKDSHNNRLFIELMKNEQHVVREISRMMRYGILGRYVPEFGHVIGMMEHDLLHIHTVDDHTFRMMRFLRRLRYSKMRESYPIASRLIHRVPKREVLYLAALLHDTGKYIEGDHCQHGERIGEDFCRQHGLGSSDTHLVSWLIGNHLTMSHAAQRLDLNNPEDIHQFALEVGDKLHLDLLYLVTVADMVSTNPKLWTSWRAEQMRELYNNTLRALRRGLGNPLNKEDYIESIQQEAIEILRLQGIDEPTVWEIWGDAGDDYFLRENVDNIIWHTIAIQGHSNRTEPLVSIRETSVEDYEGATQIFVYTQDQQPLFAVTTATLDQLNLNVQDARIMTSEKNHTAVDTYIVLDQNNQPIDDPERLREIQYSLVSALARPEDYPTLIQRRTPRILKSFPVETQVIMSNDPYMQRTILEVIAADRPGLLARVGAIFAEFNVQMQGAKILTEGERVSDIFFILDQNGQPFSDPDTCETLQQALIQGLDDQVQVQSAV